MFRLTRTKEAGLGVWDGQYEHFLDDESKTIQKNSVEEPPCQASETGISFEDRVFLRYVRLLAFVEETAWKDEWLLVLLETAREIETLSDGLLHGVYRSGHEVDIESFPTDESRWLRGPAELLKNELGVEMQFEGECLICQGLDTDYELVIFGGVNLESKVRYQTFKEAWYGSRRSGEYRNFMAHMSSSPPDVDEAEMTELAWDEAIQHYSKWVRRSFSGIPIHDVQHLKSALLDHRCERFGMALHLARLSQGDGCGKVSNLESGAAGLETELNDAQNELDDVKRENEILKERLREQGEDLEGLEAARAKASTLEEDLEKVKQELHNTVQENQTLSSDMEEALAKHTTETKELQQELKDAEDQVQCAQNNLESFKTQVDTLEEEKNSLLERVKNSEVKAEESFKSLESELKIEAAEKERKKMGQEVDKYKCRLLAIEKKLAEAQTENEKIRVEIRSQGNGTFELCIFHNDAQSLGKELGDMKAKLRTVEQEKTEFQAKIDSWEASDCDELRLARNEAQMGKEQLAIAQTKIASAENQVESLQIELAGYRRHMASLTSGTTGVNVAGSALPSSLDVIGNYNKTAQKILDIYFEYEFKSVQAQERLGASMVEVLKDMYILMKESYIRLLTSMLVALGNIESLTSMTRSTHEAYDVYCKRYWKEMFFNLKELVECQEEPAQVAGVKLCSSNEVEGNQDDKDGLNGSKTMEVNGFADPEPLPEINESHCLELDDGVDGDVPENAMDKYVGPSRPIDGSPSKSLQSLFDSFLASFPQGNGNLASSTLKLVFDELWETTIVMFLQRPQMRFSFSEQIRGQFDGEYHEHVDAPIALGQDKVSLIPRVLRAPQGFSVLTTDESLDSDAGWAQEAKSRVDAPDLSETNI